jgi:AraC-like DNA-binding protein
MSGYREIAPSSAFADTIECFWTLRHIGPTPAHRVLPDGCADIVLSGDGPLQAVGSMTRYQDIEQSGAALTVGVRFRPGAWASHLGVPADRITDAVLPLQDLWGVRAHRLREQLAFAHSLEHCAELFEASLRPETKISPVRRALQWMEQHHGCVSIDALADQSGMGPRQFRRRCLEQTGLTPKFLARVLRFRYALSRISKSRAGGAGLALDCGYYDQAHFINEFRTFSGRTPSWFGA